MYSGAGISAAISQQEGCGFDFRPGTFLCRVCMFFLRRFSGFIPQSKNMYVA